MAHVKPHRWADAARGTLSRAVLGRMEQHADACQRCARQRERVMSAMAGFGDIASTEAPQLGWDHIGARIYWVTSSERRTSRRGVRATRLRWAGAAVLAAAGVAAMLVVLIGSRSPEQPDAAAARSAEPAAGSATMPAHAPAEPAPAEPAPAARAPAEPLHGVVTFLQGEVSAAGEPVRFDDLIGPGARITTGAGKISVQFGRDSGFSLAEGSSLELRAFDQRRVELVVDGEVFVDIARRDPDQTFVVVAGQRQVHVRGTSFAVTRRGDRLRVACAHGEVAVVSESGDEVAALAGQVLDWDGKVQRAGTLDLEAIAALQREVFRVPAWPGADALRETSSTLAVAAPAGQRVDIDGVTVGAGSFSVRVMSGRHHVRAEGVPGTWLELDPGKAVNMPVNIPARPRPGHPSSAGARQRRAELEAALSGSARLHTCVRALDKQGILEGAYIVLDIGILRDGTIGHLNIVDSNLGRSTARCVRDMVDTIDFAPGPAATMQQRIAW